MDLTALELGLRNRQLLQVKCFLKIQVETFRYFLSEEFSRLPNDAERVSALDKFFAHDWQNVVNKITSVAVVNMTGDYFSKMFAILLFRSAVQACNQLLVIVSAIEIDELLEGGSTVPADEPNRTSGGQQVNFGRSRSYSSSGSSSVSNFQSSTIKDKIFRVLTRQIRSITKNLEKIHNTHLIVSNYERGASSLSIDKDEVMMMSSASWFSSAGAKSLLSNSNILVELPEMKLDNIDECLHIMSSREQVPLFQYLLRKHRLDAQSHRWTTITSRCLALVSQLLSDNEISAELVTDVCDILTQTGVACLYLLFSIFIETSSFQLRQKVLQLLLIKFGDANNLQQALEQEFDANVSAWQHLLNIENRDQLSLARYLQFMSSLDLYIFCFRAKLSDSDMLTMSIGPLLRAPTTAYIKSIILPTLYEIEVHFDLFNNWRVLNEHNLGAVWQHFGRYYLNEADFANLVTGECLWQYLIDGQRIEMLVDWIQSGQISLPYCDKIQIDASYDVCQRMVNYLLGDSFFLVRNRLLDLLALNSSFFGQYSLYQLAPDRINFSTMLEAIGKRQDHTKPLEDNNGSDKIDLVVDLLRHDSPHFNVSLLVDYCVDNKLYEFLYLLYKRHREIFQARLAPSSLSPDSRSIVALLQDLTQHRSTEDDAAMELFSKSLVIVNFLYKDGQQHRADEERIKSLLTTSKQKTDIELALMIVSLSKDAITFDRLLTLLAGEDGKSDPQLNELVCTLKSRYLLLGKSFEEELFARGVHLGVSPTFVNKIDIYTLLQQTIPFVNISQFFSWQLRRQKARSRYASGETAMTSMSSNAAAAPAAIQLSNDELPHFAQKRLTELYGLKAELTFSYYLKNSRLLEAFLHCFATKMNMRAGGRGEARPMSINPKLALKAIRKAAQIAYGSLRQPAVLASCLLFQALVHSATDTASGNGDRRQASNTFDTTATNFGQHAANKTTTEIEDELSRTRLHLALAKLIIEYAPDYLSLQSAQQQQSSLGQHLRRSHFHLDRVCAQKLLDLGAVAIERKYSRTESITRRSTGKQESHTASSLNHRLHALMMEKKADTTTPPEDETNLLMECFDWKAMLMFAELHALKRPLNFLAKCARADNWLIFTLFVQIYEIPKEEFQTVLQGGETFNNPCIGEHLLKAFQSAASRQGGNNGETLMRAAEGARRTFYSKLFKGKLMPASDTSPISSSPLEPAATTILSGESDVFSMDCSNETSSGSLQSSMFSKQSDEPNVVSLVLYDHHSLQPGGAGGGGPTGIHDFLQLILDIYQSCIHFGQRMTTTTMMPANDMFDKSFTATLFYAAVSLSSPTLALLACSVTRDSSNPEPQSSSIQIRSPNNNNINIAEQSSLETNTLSERLQFTAFMVWLLARVDVDTKQTFIDLHLDKRNKKIDDQQPLITSERVEAYLRWPLNKCHQLIDVITRRHVNSFIILSQAFTIFAVDIPIINKLLQFLIQFFVEKDYYQSSDLLKEFQTLLATYDEKQVLAGLEATAGESDSGLYDNLASLNVLHTKSWIEKCSLTLITNSLILAQQFELGILLSHYNYVRIHETFSGNNATSSSRVPDIRRLYQFNHCLAKLPNFRLPISQLLFPPTEDINLDVHYVNIFRQLIFDLQEANHFEEARNLMNLLPKANLNEFIISEWMLKAKQLEPTNKAMAAERQFSQDGNGGQHSLEVLVDLDFWDNCWTQVARLDPSMHSSLRVMERFIEQLKPGQLLLKCFLYLKCMLAIESILHNSIETDTLAGEDNVEEEGTVSEDDSPDRPSVDVYELVHDYFNIEHCLWRKMIDCERLVAMKRAQMMDKMSEVASAKSGRSASIMIESTGDQGVIDVWERIVKEILAYVKTSKMANEIMPVLSKRYSFKYTSLKSRASKVNEQQHLQTLAKTQNVSFSSLIGRMLSAFCIAKAKEVAELFDFTHLDFQIIQSCDEAARGILRRLVDVPVDLQMKVQTMRLHSSSTTAADEVVEREQRNTIELIQTLTRLATIGRLACEQILLYYRISSILSLPYSSLVNYTSLKLFELLITFNRDEPTSKSSAMLADLRAIQASKLTDSIGSTGENVKTAAVVSEQTSEQLKWPRLTSYMEAIGCAKDLLRLVGQQEVALDDEEKIVDFLAKVVLDGVRALVGKQFDRQSNDEGTEIELDKSQMSFNSDRFNVLLRLLKEPSLLGHKLIDVCRKEKATFEETYERFIRPRSVHNIIANNSGGGSKLSQSYTAHSARDEALTAEDFVEAKRRHYGLLVELYIHAHQCFSSQCDVRGIALVLKKTRQLITQHLTTERYFHLILRLLTGIGRYSEMTYCFDIFHEADRFEMILSKRVSRTPQLRIALLNYIKNSEQSVGELLPLVAIRFFLFRETADYHRVRAEQLLSKFYHQYFQLLMSSASAASSAAAATALGTSARLTPSSSYASIPKRVSLISQVEGSPKFSCLSTFVNSARLSGMTEQLMSIMYEYQEAETNYQKASSYSNADHCSRRAQLMALQVSYLNQSRGSMHAADALASSATTGGSTSIIQLVLNLEPGKVREFVLSCPKFYEAYIVAQAYNCVPIDWADAFFNVVILNNNLTYLDHFMDVFSLSLSMLDKLVKRLDQVTNSFKTSASRTRELYPTQQQQQQQHSPSSVVLSMFMAHIRNDLDIQRSRKLLERILERALVPPAAEDSCPLAGSATSNAKAKVTPPFNKIALLTNSIEDKFRLAKHFGSKLIIEQLLDKDCEHSAYLLDLKRNNRL